MTNFAFVCEKQPEDAWPEDHHTTSTAMVRCPRCRRHAVGGYWCDTCGHTDVNEPDQVAGHGSGRCEERTDA